MTKQLTVSLISAMQSPILSFLGGFNFDTRGWDAAFCYGLAVFLFVAIYHWPGWRK